MDFAQEDDFKEFRDLKVTTMTIVSALSGEIDYLKFYRILQTIYKTYPFIKSLGKDKLPFCEKPGTIISIRGPNGERGVKTGKSPFKNAITMDMATSTKNVSIKLSKKSIHISGANSFTDGEEAVGYIMEKLTRVQNMIDRLNGDDDKKGAFFDWMVEKTKGSNFNVRVVTKKEYGAINIYFENFIPENTINTSLPEEHDFDKEIVDYLASFFPEFDFHREFVEFLAYFFDLDHVIKGVNILGTEMAMVNYNYKLGFQVDRLKLDQFINGNNGFLSRYNNSLATCVTIELPYIPNPNSIIKRKKNKVPHHTILVYKSGSVTFSANDTEKAEETYNLFIDVIRLLRDFIEYKEDE